MQIISHSEFVVVTHNEIFFQWKDGSPGHGMAFKCDSNGIVDMVELEQKPAALENYRKCLDGTHAVLPGEFKSWKHGYREPAIGRCNCGCEVVLDSSWANSCEGCNREYNGSGQLLAHRSQWGEETGESAGDFINLDCEF